MITIDLVPFLPSLIWLGAVIYIIGWCLWIKRFDLNPRSRRYLITPIVLALISASLLFSGSYCRRVSDELICTFSRFPVGGQVTDTQSHLHAAPDDQSQVIGKLNSGESVKILAKEGSWTQIEVGSGRRGWVPNNGIGVLQ